MSFIGLFLKSIFIMVLMIAVFLIYRKSTTSELQSHSDLVCRLLLEKKKKKHKHYTLYS